MLMVDDHPLLRKGLHTLIDSAANITVVGETSDRLEAIDQVAALAPDVVVMDITMTKLDGVHATRHIMSKAPHTRVVALSNYASKPFVDGMLQVGTAGYVLKDRAGRAGRGNPFGDARRAFPERHEPKPRPLIVCQRLWFRALQPGREFSDQWIRTETVQNDAQQDGANHGHRDGIAAGKLRVEYDHRKHDTGQAAGSEPAHEQLFVTAQIHTGHHQENRQHARHGQAEYCIKHHLPTEGIERLTDHHGPEHHPGDQRQSVARPFRGQQILWLVFLGNGAEQQATGKGRDEATAAEDLR